MTAPAPEFDRNAIATIWRLLLMGWWYPLPAVSTYFQRKPTSEKLTHHWTRSMVRSFDIRFLDQGEHEPYTDSRSIVLCPHRSSADFFVHKYLMRGTAATLARAGVGFYFPLLYLTTRTDRSTWFFRRDAKKRSRQELFGWLDRQFDSCDFNGLIVYPEGHRNLSARPLPLKRGLIDYAHSRELPVQILMTGRTELVLSEQKMSHRRGVEIAYRFDRPISSVGRDRNRFFRDVSERFRASFAEIHPTHSKI